MTRHAYTSIRALLVAAAWSVPIATFADVTVTHSPALLGLDAVTSGSFLEDGVADVAISRTLENTISVLLGQSDGTFTQAGLMRLPTVGYVMDIEAERVDADAHDDLIALTIDPATGWVSAWFMSGDGAGGFGAPIETPVRQAGELTGGSIAIGALDVDVDVNDRADLALTTSNGPGSPGTLSILLGNGDGTFVVAHHFATDPQPAATEGVVTGDFDESHAGDDIAVVHARGSGVVGSLWLFRGAGDGTFTVAGVFDTCQRNPLFLRTMPNEVNIDDMHLDVITCDRGPADVPGNELSVFLGDGLGGFTRHCKSVIGEDGTTRRPFRGALGGLGDGRPHDLGLVVGPDEPHSAPDAVLFVRVHGDGTFETVMEVDPGLARPSACVMHNLVQTSPGDEIITIDSSGYLVATVDAGADVLGISDAGDARGTAVGLSVHPNPSARAPLTLRYELRRAGHVAAGIYDVNGRLVRRLVDDVRASGPHALRWDGRSEQGRDVSGGVYLYRVETADGQESSKIVITRPTR